MVFSLKVGQQLPDSNHVVRYVAPSKLRRDGDDNVVGFLHSAFELREGESSLSVSQLEFFPGARPDQIADCVRANRNSIKVKPSSAFAIGNVGKLKEVGQRQVSGTAVKIVFSPSPNNLAHTSVQKLPRDEFALFETLATEVFVEMVMNAAIP
jgi:hypothetical protein